MWHEMKTNIPFKSIPKLDSLKLYTEAFGENITHQLSF